MPARIAGQMVVVAAFMATACGGKTSDNQAIPADAIAQSPSPAVDASISLPDSRTAAAMARPALPAFVSGDCPGPDPCEFGRTWDTCEEIPVLRERRDGAAALRQLKANEAFVAESGAIELVAPGKIRMLQASNPDDTGGLTIARNTMIEAYGPLQSSRSLYYDPNSGKGWSPPSASDEPWLYEGKVAQLVVPPKMTWWVKVKLQDGQSGWLQLRSTERTDTFPVYDSKAVVRSWDITMTRDDETPDCAGLLAMRG